MCKIPAEAKQSDEREKKKGESLRNTHHMKCAAKRRKDENAPFLYFYFLYVVCLLLVFSFERRERKEKNKNFYISLSRDRL